MAFSHIIGFDDSPFDREDSERVKVVGAVCAGTRLHGVLSFEVTRDGADSAQELIAAVQRSRFAEHLQLVMLQGIAFAGFNVVDVFEVHSALGVPVLVISRRCPDRQVIRRVLEQNVERGEEKWAVLEKLGEMELHGAIWVQRVGIESSEVDKVIARSVVEGNLPEPIRLAHLIAGGVVAGESRGRA